MEDQISLEDLARIASEMAWCADCARQDREYQLEVIGRTGEELARISGAVADTGEEDG